MTRPDPTTPPTPPSRGLNIALWVVQALLALFFLMAGFNHAFVPIEQAAKSAPWVASIPVLARFIGVAEVLGGVGLILASLTRVAPKLTVLAAAGLGLIMALAVPFHIVRGEANVVGMHIVIAALALFVAWGRWSRAPIAPR